jgi:CheY-like chemotaxis protein
VVNLTVGRRILEMLGYNDIASVLDGQQAIEAAEKRSYDLVLLDLQMPVLDGFGAHQRIKASPLAGDPCVVALTANADRVSAFELPRELEPTTTGYRKAMRSGGIL